MCIFLDIRADRYVSFDRRKVEPFLSRRFSWPEIQPASNAINGSDDEVERVLIRRGLLLNRGGEHRPIRPAAIVPATHGRAIMPRSLTNTPSALTIARFALAILLADRELQSRPISTIVDSLKESRARRDDLRRPNERNLARLVEQFLFLLPFAPGSRVCLKDSYRLLKFLSFYQLQPHWVWAVRAAPFNAHCWVQHEDEVLNDDVESTQRYVPIMVI
jgi:hypothetical protein